VQTGLRAHQELPDQSEVLEKWAPQDHRGLRAVVELPGRAVIQESEVIRDRQDQTEHLALLDQQEPKAIPASLE
jgi:hypothetical protein